MPLVSLDSQQPLVIHRSNHRHSDELELSLYECPKCGFDSIPYGVSAWDSEGPQFPERHARFCPGCGTPIVWVGSLD